MGKFTKKKKGMDTINTASLPDIVFMLLFFFMVVTVIKSEDPQVKIEPPSASELASIEQKHLVKYIFIGPPLNSDRMGSAAVIQLDDDFARVDQIQDWVAAKRNELQESEQNKIVISLKVDKSTKMGIVTAVKQELREATALKIIYSTSERGRTGSE